MTKRSLKTSFYAAGAVTLALSVTTASFAQFQRSQPRQNQQSTNPLGDLIGLIANASAKSKAKKGWAQITPEIQQCVNTFVASKNLNVDALIAAGMPPSHEQMVPIVTMCQTVMATQLKANFPCNVANAKGQQVPTTCVQSYAKAVNGKWVPVSRDDFLRAGSNNEQVTITDFETQVAQNTRLAEEKRLAQEAAAKAEAARLERLEAQKRFAASPEGKRQAAERHAERIAQEKRLEAQRRQRPRGYQLACSGVESNSYYVSDPEEYNRKLINCNDPSGVKDAMWWAVRRMQIDGVNSYTVSVCSKSINYYSEFNTRGRMVQHGGFLNACNVGLSEVKGPSLEEAMRRKR